MSDTVSTFLALLALLSTGLAVATFTARLRADWWRRWSRTMGPWALPIAWAIAIVATSGSLYYSEVRGFIPCELCWYQRIAMYPQTLILGAAVLTAGREVRRYAAPLAVLGSAFSAFHVWLQRVGGDSAFCTLDAPCAVVWVQVFGFITIPVMALAGFLGIVAMLSVAEVKR